MAEFLLERAFYQTSSPFANGVVTMFLREYIKTPIKKTCKYQKY
ncbi:MAG: hypothetical protein ACW96S_11655 [Promethearchaeota archaeon]|jgi:hypothetical protein